MSVTADTIKADISLSKYTLEQKLETVVTFLVLGNIRKVGAMVDIPARTITDWVKTDWWAELVTRVREEKKDELNAGYNRILDNSLKGIENRIEHGDAYLLKGKDEDGNEIADIHYKPVSIMDLAKTHGIIFDKRQLLNNQATNITNNVSSEELANLKAQFEQLSGKTIPGERIE